VWDAWCRVADLHDAGAVTDGRPTPAPRVPDLIDQVTAPERRLLRGYAARNRAMAHRFRHLWTRGRLLYAHRLVLPHVALYHWNQHGFTLEERASMISAMMRAWFPHR